ncbi:MAG: PHP domain-containing protein [candidate division WS1 bacterium]|jgi:predicted metal-dependent phosphoesterase TrpH|nr:PHP domain-containing protein [candidate division WS1 bacterium]
MSCDLHIHSICSDGTQTPEEIVAEAIQKKLTAIALADHDTVAGVETAMNAARGSDLRVIPAAEISTEYQKTEVHILGYWIKLDDEQLHEKFRYVREARRLRAEEIVRKLRSLGIEITLEDVVAQSDGVTLGRPHVAQALMAKGYIKGVQEAFDRYLGRDRPAFVPRYKLSPYEAVESIRDARGCPVLAHPGLGVSDRVIDGLIEAGIQGLEAYHNHHTPSNTRRVLRIAQERGLLVTGGTDSHGPGGSHPVAVGDVDVPDSCAEGLVAWAREHGAPMPE